MATDLAALKSELLELDRQLQKAAHHPAHGAEAEALQSGQLAALRQRLDQRLATLDGSAWQVLLLEWRYDFALLFDQIRLWMAQVDASFDTGPVLKK
ncbi:hypothetical protein [Shinella zoogloeoides]|uniref:hypothetical protein n=1 Tax=Shinella zoogloeoides TaxID=352475 RepID=UPI001FDEA462|nr:hypothetical protein [Shinella zoogloeoides]WPE23700.1 hypothetical protein ShzoTeo12_49200 [Shinella zoogloeoides]